MSAVDILSHSGHEYVVESIFSHLDWRSILAASAVRITIHSRSDLTVPDVHLPERPCRVQLGAPAPAPHRLPRHQQKVGSGPARGHSVSASGTHDRV